jgi:hypothetical protein
VVDLADHLGTWPRSGVAAALRAKYIAESNRQHLPNAGPGFDVIYAIRPDHSAARPPDRAPPARTKAAGHPGRPSGLRITEREPRDPRTQPRIRCYWAISAMSATHRLTSSVPRHLSAC